MWSKQLVFWFWFLLTLLKTCSTSDISIVETQYGTLQGVITSMGREFLAVPYATPPIDDLRFSPPLPPQPWNGTYLAQNQLPGCMQHCSSPWWLCPAVKSEDCLYLNIFTPLPTDGHDEKVPVLIFIHGGSFIMYYAGAIVGNATRVANLTNTIYVVINYRLGAFGYYYNEDLGLSGNYGYLDQKQAIFWVYENIAAFGGDPNRIVVAGESAGAQSVHLLTVDKDEKLQSIVKGAIMESNPVSVPYRTPESWGLMPPSFVLAVGCNLTLTPQEQLACLRKADSNTLLQAQGLAEDAGGVKVQYTIHDVEPWSPTVKGIDGLFSDQPQWLWEQGQFMTEIPMIIGVNRDEFTLFMYEIFYGDEVLLPPELFIMLELLLGPKNAPLVWEYYNVSLLPEVDTRPLGSKIFTDGLFHCPTRYLAAQAYKYASGVNEATNGAYLYHFNHPSSFNNYAFDSVEACWDMVCHAAELPYITTPMLWPVNANASYTPAEWDLGQTFQYYWTALGWMGYPNLGNPKSPLFWLKYGPVEQNTMILDVPPPDGSGVVIMPKYEEQTCAFWDALGYSWNH